VKVHTGPGNPLDIPIFELVIFIDLIDEQQCASWLQHTLDFLQVMNQVGPEVISFKSSYKVKSVVRKR